MTAAETEKEVQKEKKVVVSNHSDRSQNSRKKWTTIEPHKKINKSLQKTWQLKYDNSSWTCSAKSNKKKDLYLLPKIAPR